MNERRLQTIGVLAFSVWVGLIAFPTATAQAADKLGKIFIRAATPDSGGQQFVDAGLEDTVKDMKRRAGDLVVVDDEASADFLMVIVTRDDTPVSGQPTAKRVTVNLSVRDGASWKPGIKISKVSEAWGLTARHVLGDAKKWIEKNVKMKN